MNRVNVRRLLQAFDFKRLFIEEMGWSHVAGGRPVLMPIEGINVTRTPIAQMSGVTVFEVCPMDGRDIPDAKQRRAIYNVIEKLSHENLLIFVDSIQPESRTKSLWYWMKREGNTPRPREHLYLKGQPGDLFLSKLDSMVIELDDLRPDGTIPITEVTARLASSLDIERVTKKFFNEFSDMRKNFTSLIEGIDKETDRFWYASIVLNRLMFIYFLQMKSFIQENTHYLEDKLLQSKERGKDRFYAEFLDALFFEGFAKPADQRSKVANELLAPKGGKPDPYNDIVYLNGGLFLRHREFEKLDRNPKIRIPDQAFENVFSLFSDYSWHLDDTPGASDNEINPDVIGYIFEKYINQKAFGAYYTRTEITQYLCEKTINTVIVDKINSHFKRNYKDIGDILLRLDAPLCEKLLELLPTLSILDPACGSGAFLVAAMKSVLNLYAAVFGRIEFLANPTLTEKMNNLLEDHRSPNYFIRKKIITDNLYGVDVMEEATEIARLRLFLFLVSSVQSVDQLEPLPNIDFNIMYGNSLIGLLRIDEKRFNTKGTVTQLNLFQEQKSQQYHDLLKEKDELIEKYRHPHSSDDIDTLKRRIEKHKETAYQTLNEILLDDFTGLRIFYEEAQSTGRAKRRPLAISDIGNLKPFHWGYEFDHIINTRGGFDVVITNPPWEIFKPIDREFAKRYDSSFDRRGANIKEFQAKFDLLLKNPEIERAYFAYLSEFPYVSAFFRSLSQYEYQGSGDVNLYKLFTERSVRLLRTDGQCGIVLPSGIYSDLGTKALREMLFSSTQITGLFSFENRKTIFEGVHSRFKFAVLTLKKGGQTKSFPAAFMRLEPEELEAFPDENAVDIDIELVYRLSPDSLSITEFKGDIDIIIAKKMAHYPLLGEEIPNKWKLQLTSEFHMTSDSMLFNETRKNDMSPLYEGKMIWHFNSYYAEPRYWVDKQEGRKAIIGTRGKDTGQQLDYQQYRFGCRTITGATNERTMVCSITPKDVFCGNSLLVSKRSDNQISDEELLYLTAVMSSYVVDFSFRQRIATQMNIFFIYQTSVPRLTKGDPFFSALVERAARLICVTPEFDDLARSVGLSVSRDALTNEVNRAQARAEIDAIVAHLYKLTELEFAHILGTFPIVTEAVKVAAQNAYRDVERGLIK